MTPLLLTAYTATTCIGRGLDATLAALCNDRSGLTPCAFETVRLLDTWIGEVGGVDQCALPPSLADYDCRNNRLALLALETDGFAGRVRELIDRMGSERIGLFLGTSTSGILQTELAYRRRDPVTGALPEDLIYRTTQNSFSVSEFVRAYFGLEGPAMTISAACSSSAKVFGAAARQIACGTIDAAVVGGVDSLCLTTLYGFSSLQLTSSRPCRPYDETRDGISVSEGGAFALLEPAPQKPAAGSVLLLGCGESSDAYHMSSPHPEGWGAQMAMEAALKSAGLVPGDIDYLNLHGTGTPGNDAAEGKAVGALFGERVLCSSTKGATGHALGAAGAIEAVLCALALSREILPGSPHTEKLDPAIKVNYLFATRTCPSRFVVTNSFGFGGSNCSLVLGVAG